MVSLQYDHFFAQELHSSEYNFSSISNARRDKQAFRIGLLLLQRGPLDPIDLILVQFLTLKQIESYLVNSLKISS